MPLTLSLVLNLELLHLPRHLLLAAGHGVGHDLQPTARQLVPGHGPGDGGVRHHAQRVGRGVVSVPERHAGTFSSLEGESRAGSYSVKS